MPQAALKTQEEEKADSKAVVEAAKKKAAEDAKKKAAELEAKKVEEEAKKKKAEQDAKMMREQEVRSHRGICTSALRWAVCQTVANPPRRPLSAPALGSGQATVY